MNENSSETELSRKYQEQLDSSYEPADQEYQLAKLRQRIRRESNIQDLVGFGFSLVVMTLVTLLSRLSVVLKQEQEDVPK